MRYGDCCKQCEHRNISYKHGLNMSFKSWVTRRICEDVQVLKNWEKLGVRLGLADYKIYQIQRRFAQDDYEACYCILTTWYNSIGNEATIDSLILALKDCKFHNIANILEKERAEVF